MSITAVFRKIERPENRAFSHRLSAIGQKPKADG